MKTKSLPIIPRNGIAALALLLIGIPGLLCAQIITIPNNTFDSGSGQIAGELTLLGGSSTVGPAEIGTSGWYGRAAHTDAGVLTPLAGYRPGIEIDFDGSSTNVGEISYALGLDLGGLAGLEMPEADIWRPITGQSLLANTTYQFSIDVDAGGLLDLNALGSRGFGIGVTGGATDTTMGTFVADSLSTPSFADISLLSGTLQRLTLTFTTSATPPPGGDIGVVIFAGRGSQALSLGLLSDYDIDNASLEIVPEPATVLLFGLGLVVLLRGHRFVRSLGRSGGKTGRA